MVPCPQAVEKPSLCQNEAYTDNLAADVVVTSTSGGIAPELFEQLRSLENVTAASELVRSKGWIEEPYDTSHTSDPWPLLGLNGPVYDGKVTAGSMDDLTGSSVALPPDAATKLKVGVGSEIGWIAVVLLLVLPVTAVAGRLAMRPQPMEAIASPLG